MLNNKKYPGKLIIVEGLDMSGKSTLIKDRLIPALKRNNIPFSQYREPGSTPLGDKLREILVNENNDKLTEIFLFSAARIELFKKHILPDLEQGKVVLLDRSFLSTYVYQSKYEQYLFDIFKISIPEIFKGELDIKTFVLKISYEEYLIRKSKRLNESNEKDNMDKEEFNDRDRRYISIIQKLKNILNPTILITNKENSIDAYIDTLGNII